MGKLGDWEKVRTEPLGSGGQSTVYLVRRPEREAAREKSFKILRDLSGQGFNDKTALDFSTAACDLARPEDASELGALKMFHPRAAGPDAEQQALNRMRNEIAVLIENRPGLLKFLDYNESENWIVTEYCPGGTLENHLPKYKGNAKLALKSFFSLVQTVKELHSKHVVHRDIKPQNIFIGEIDELLLGDFGIVFLPNQADRLSVTGESVGPRDFMPPWVFREEHPTINPSFDVYMLGKVLWCMVTGRLKLHREDFLDPRFDVTKLYPNDPDMHIINKILGKCVVPQEKDCLASALDLWLVVGAFLEMIQHGGHLWNVDVPKHCHVCGVGYYQADRNQTGLADAFASLALQALDHSDRLLGAYRISPFVCERCGHMQVFKI